MTPLSRRPMPNDIRALAPASALAELQALRSANEQLLIMAAEEQSARKAADSELATLRAQVERLTEWRDVVSLVDDGEKTFFAWGAGGAAPEGEFSRIGLRRITSDGREVFREYTAEGPWMPYAITEGAAL